MGLFDRIAWSRSSSASYDSLVSEEEKFNPEGGQELPHNASLKKKHDSLATQNRLLYAVVFFLTAALFVISIAYLWLATREPLSTRPLHCGTTVAEAVSAGCTFDMLSKAWLHPKCPRFGEQEYLDSSQSLINESSWSYWRDPDGSNELSQYELSQLTENKPGETWSWAGTDREHVVHCTYIIIRLAEAYNKGARVDGLTANFPHTKHCVLMMMRKAMWAPDLDRIATRGDVILGSC